MCRGDNACPVCLSIQVSVAHAKVGKRFRNHKSVACFFLSPSPSPSPSLSLSLSFSLPLSFPLSLSPSEYVMEKGIRIYASHSKAGEGVSLYISFDNKEYQPVQNPCALPFLFILRQQKKERERRDAQDIMIKNAGANPSLSVCAPDRTRTYTSQDTRS